MNGWAETLSWLIDMFGANAMFFRLIERNRHTTQAVHDSFHESLDHLQIQERVEAAVHAAAASTGEEIRMFAALGAVTAFDDWAPKLLVETPPDVIQREARRGGADDPRRLIFSAGCQFDRPSG